MKKNNILVLAITGTLITLCVIFLGQLALKPEQVVKHQVTSKLGAHQPSPNTIQTDESDNKNPKSTLQIHNTSSVSSTKIAYDDDWCIAFTDLNQQDFAYFEQEIKDWNIIRGRILPNTYAGRVRGNNESSQYIAPYMEASYATIWQQIKADNEFAMIAALYRPDFHLDLELQRKIALKLVVKGHTSTALSHLVTIELIHAKAMYKPNSQINKDILPHLYRAIAYTIYGIKNFDLNPTFAYLDIIGSADFPLELKPRYTFGTNNRIQESVDLLTQWIEKERDNEDLQLPTADEFPKAVKHDFERRLATLHLEFDKELHDLQTLLPEATSTLLANSECVQRQMAFFADLHSKAN